MTRFRQIWNPGCYSSLTNPHRDWHKKQFQCPHGLELLRLLHKTRISFLKEFQCPHGLELLLIMDGMPVQRIRFNALSGLSCYDMVRKLNAAISKVSMPSRAYTSFLLIIELGYITYITLVSMPSRAYTSFLQRIIKRTRSVF